MKPPTTVPVIAQQYRILVADQAVENLVSANGATDCSAGVIVIMSQPPGTMRKNLVHELLHAALWESGLSVMHSDADAVITVEQEERVCTALASILLDTLRRSPRLVAFLLEP